MLQRAREATQHDVRVHRISVLLLMALCQAVNADAEGLEAVGFGEHRDDADVGLFKQTLL